MNTKQHSLLSENSNASTFAPKFNQSYPKDIQKLKPTIAYNLYWYFAAERQNTFYNRYTKTSRPWTTDTIITKYKFTNPYRATDRTSQFLIKEVIYAENNSPDDVLFRILLFKLFNKIETWNLLKKQSKEISIKTFNVELYDKILTNAMHRGERIYSAAYIMPSGGRHSEFKKKHRMHLELINKIIADKLYLDIVNASALKMVYDRLISYPSIGSFLAFQYAIDINYSHICNHSENEFIVAGPGAVSGITKCFRDLGSYDYSDVIKLMCDIQDHEFSRLNLQFKRLNNRKLHLIDCQNLFCETDKYARIACPEIVGTSNRTRIKQVFKPNPLMYDLYFPPKWNINIHTPFENNND